MNKENRDWVIYVLKCPDSGLIRYVGWTVDFVNRMAVHRYRAKKKRQTYCERWINKLMGQGKDFVSEIVQHGNGPWEFAEQSWIRHFRAVGMPLTNLTDGGEGCLGWKAPEHVKDKMRNRTYRKWTDDERKRCSDRNKGRVFTPEWKEKIRQAKLKSNPAKGKHQTEEHKAKIAAGVKAARAVKKW